MLFDNLPLDINPSPPDDNITVVRVRISCWADGQGIYQKKSLTCLRRKSHGFNILEEEINAVGADALDNIINFNECDEGIYQLVSCNEERDYFTGCIDNYDLRLIKLDE